MSTSHREAGGGIPSIGALFSETLTDVMNNIVGYLMMGLALMAVAIPVGIFASIVSLIVLYGVMGVGVFASLAGGAAMQEATGDEDLGGMVGALGSMGSIAVAFLLFFAFLLFLAAAMASTNTWPKRGMYPATREVPKYARMKSPCSLGCAIAWPAQSRIDSRAPLRWRATIGSAKVNSAAGTMAPT